MLTSRSYMDGLAKGGVDQDWFIKKGISLLPISLSVSMARRQ